jgi:hypothetical protein
MMQSVPYRTYVLPSAPEDYVGRRIRNDKPFVCKTLVTMGEQDGPVCRYIFPCRREGLRCELGNVPSLRDSPTNPMHTRHFRGGLQVVPSPFDKLRAGSS